VGYSTPVNTELTLDQLQEHLHSDVELPDAVPYVTSYFNRTWGFCLTHRQRQSLPDGTYRAVIRGTLEPGSLTYGELVIPGESDREVFVTTYVCHPSLANNELSGPVVSTALAIWLMSLPRRRYTYRFVWVPESIGALTYTSRNLDHLRSHVIAGFNLTCIGDDGDYSYLASRLADLEIDRIGRRVVATRSPAVEYSYLDRGSDERTYCAPGIDLPLISLMRTKYGSYREYHTSLDDLTVITPSGLQGGLDLVRDCVELLESNEYYVATVLGEPQLGRRGLYHAMHARTVADIVLMRTHVLAYCDGEHSVLDLADLLDLPVDDVLAIIDELVDHGLLVRLPSRKVAR
jgi:aminopeptidase-like protein